jgi:hypothetical protein
MRQIAVDGLEARHQRACAGFTAIVAAVASEDWAVPTPCSEWDAAALVEHVIGVLGDDRLHRDADYFDGVARRPDSVLPALTTDVLVHSWDLARAVGAPAALAPDLCELAYRDALAGRDGRSASGLFRPEVPVPPDAGLVARLVALLGRDPAWRPPGRD